jgi:alkanesulfonate monooxygenase SsuD/methylene tetrahydromethanopterin reductase-like flavin-dependent oxidoreductase (luciferase family)
MPIPLRAGALNAEINDLRAQAAAAGRDPASIAVVLYGVPADADALRAYAAADVQRAIFSLPSAGRDVVLPLLDRYAAVAREVGARP